MSRAGRRIAVAISVLALAAVGGVWLSRVPIATHVIDRELARKGVTAHYRVEDLGLGRQRLTDVVIGDPARPDLVADWVETHTDIGLSGPKLIAARAGHVRIAARLQDGRVSLGAIDRLLPPSKGGPFAMPALDLDVADAQIALATPYGRVAARLSGRGRLDDGFRGRLAARAPALAWPGCRVERPAADVAIRIVATAPRLAGPVGAAAVACGEARVGDVGGNLDVGLSPALDRWFGRTRFAARQVTTGGVRLGGPRGTISFRGDGARTTGTAMLTLTDVQADAVRAGATRLTGQWRVGGGRATLAGRVAAEHAALGASLLRRIASFGAVAAGSPLAPLIAGVVRDGVRAARDMQVTGQVAVATGTPTLVTIERGTIASASGARATLDDGAITIGHPAGVQVAGRMTLGGGGLPSATVRLAQAAPGAAIGGEAIMSRYARGGAALAVTPVRFTAGGGGTTRVATTATLDGPLGDGRVEQVRVPVEALWDRRGRLSVNRDCTPVSVGRLEISSLTLGRSAMRLCPTGRALVEVGDGAVRGGARLGATQLNGTLGGSPLRLAVGGATLTFDRPGFALHDVQARLGAPERETRIDADRLTGRLIGGGVDGSFAGGGGRIGNVPLVMSAGEGTWRFADGRLALNGTLRVADAAPAPRFQPMAARRVSLTLDDGTICVAGDLVEPTTDTAVAAVAIDHRLSSGAGQARLTVPGIAFTDTFQPDLLTRLTFGVIADVRGTMRGVGDIRWDARGVSSTGTFSTDAMNLAAAFGPVQGLAGTIRFTDLLGLVTAPAQVATVASINPGIPVTDGRIVYRLLTELRVQVDTGRWPFAGGTLTLDPTVLDFDADAARRLTFRVAGMDAGQFLQRFDFKNLNATGTFDGVLPMIFDGTGGRIAGGRLTARDAGGSIAYLGELTERDLGFWGNLAFQSLRSLTYRSLDVQMDGPLAGEMVTGVRFNGIKQGKGAQSNFLLRRLTRLPIQFNITIRAPFRGLIDSAASFYDPQRLVKRNLQALIDEQNRKTGVQPPASEKVP